MKTMTCRQLGGACDKIFRANTFEEIAKLSQAHGREMYQKDDAAHKLAMEEMMNLMKDAQAMKEWLNEKKALFDGLPES